MISLVVSLSIIAGTVAFAPLGTNVARIAKISMQSSGYVPPAGSNMKLQFDGTYKAAGEHLKEYVLENDNGARAVVRTFGCNAFTWTTADGTEVMGKRADAVDIESDSKPYAGGAPHCFPQFGPGALMQHGFARGMVFTPEERAKKMSFDRMIFKLQPTQETIDVWNHNFEYRVDVTLRADSLEWDVIVINLGDQPFDCTLGLHNYYDVSSLKNVKIQGPFSGATTVNKETGSSGKASSDEVTINGPIDMVYKGVTGPVTISDSGKGTVLTLESKGYADTCIWNPYGNSAMGFDKFVCVEPVTTDPISIPPGKFKETKFYHKVTYKKM